MSLTPLLLLLTTACHAPSGDDSARTAAADECPDAAATEVIRDTTGYITEGVPSPGTDSNTWWAYPEPAGCVSSLEEAAAALSLVMLREVDPSEFTVVEGVWYTGHVGIEARYLDCGFVQQWSDEWMALHWPRGLPITPDTELGWGEQSAAGYPVLFQLSDLGRFYGDDLVMAIEHSLEQSSAGFAGTFPDEDFHLVSWAVEADTTIRYRYCRVYEVYGAEYLFTERWELEPETGRVGFWREGDGVPF